MILVIIIIAKIAIIKLITLVFPIKLHLILPIFLITYCVDQKFLIVILGYPYYELKESLLLFPYAFTIHLFILHKKSFTL